MPESEMLESAPTRTVTGGLSGAGREAAGAPAGAAPLAAGGAGAAARAVGAAAAGPAGGATGGVAAWQAPRTRSRPSQPRHAARIIVLLLGGHSGTATSRPPAPGRATQSTASVALSARALARSQRAERG